MKITLRRLCEEDIATIVATDGGGAWHGGRKKWNRYWSDQQRGSRLVLLAEAASGIVGYGSLNRSSQHTPFRNAGIPEIQDLVVAENRRHLGVGTRLIRALERAARSEGYSQIGLGVGLYRDYGAAQRLYIHLGYAPDGNGISFRNVSVEPGARVKVDDHLVLWLVRSFAVRERS